jgi:NAD(P)-dependent dehydrogenase (short-subunit alcohol dehydrogenase family)
VGLQAVARHNRVDMSAGTRNSRVHSSRVWFITGASSGLGRALAETVLDRGERAVVTARKPERLLDFIERYPVQALVLELDVTRFEQAKAVISQAVERFGRIDVLVNNAGYGLLGAAEELDISQLRRQFEANFFGLVNITRTVLPIMRRARGGWIVNISSVGGVRAIAGFSAYSATKFAVEGFSEALAQEVAPLGIAVTIVEPGRFRTDWAGRSLEVAPATITDYASTVGATRDLMASLNGNQEGDPVRGAAAIIQAVDAERPPLRLALGADAVAAIRQKLAAAGDELRAWEAVSVSTGFPDTDDTTVGSRQLRNSS